ncbi:MAG: phosphate signaling complex protein PhoU [Erysipelotrichaceae bacterium]
MTKLDVTLDSLDYTLMKMYRKIFAMHEKVEGLFETFDAEIALSIIEDDAYVNNLEIEINDQATYAIALMQPVAGDLRRIVASFKIATELERIGDYAKNIASILIKTDKTFLDDALVNESFIQMSKHFKVMIAETFVAYEHRDADKAFEIGKTDRVIDKMVSDLIGRMNDQHDVPFAKALYVTKVLRNMERSGDHTLNICEQVIYLNKGQHYEFG